MKKCLINSGQNLKIPATLSQNGTTHHYKVVDLISGRFMNSHESKVSYKRHPVWDFTYTANVNRQTTDKLLFSYAIITGENV